MVTEERAVLKPLMAAHLSEREFSSIDIGIATAQLCLAPRRRACPRAFSAGWTAGRSVRPLGLPEDTRVRLVIAVGYALPDDPLRKKQRKPLEQVLAIHE